MKNNETQSKFMQCQIQALDIDKWYEGLRIHKDPSTEYILQWVKNNAQLYRNKWFHSTCVSCPRWKECGWKAVEQCHEGEEVMFLIMNDIFTKQYEEQSTVGNHNNGCGIDTIHYFSARVIDGEVILKIKRKTGELDNLLKDINSKYKCISIVIGIPFLIKKSEENTNSIQDYLEENQWI